MSTADWPEGLRFAEGCQIWVFPERRVVYTEATLSEVGPREAHGLIDVFEWLLSEIPDQRLPVVVHDWRALKKIPRAARQVFLARRHEIGERPKRVLIAANVNPLVRMVIRSLGLAAQVMNVGTQLEIVENPLRALEELGVGTPDAALHARLRQGWRRTPQSWKWEDDEAPRSSLRPTRNPDDRKAR